MYYNFVNRQRKPKKRSKKWIIALVVLVLILGGIMSWYVNKIRPVLLLTAEASVKSMTTLAVNNAVLSVITGNGQYDNLISIQKDAQDNITMLTANSIVINTLSRNTASIVQSRISELEDVGVAVPLGTLSGIPFLTGLGADVSIKVSPIGTVNCSFSSEFISAGINQTLHQIYLNVDSEVDIIIPTLQKTLECSTQVLICETIIVGKIPDTYLSGSIFSS